VGGGVGEQKRWRDVWGWRGQASSEWGRSGGVVRRRCPGRGAAVDGDGEGVRRVFFFSREQRNGRTAEGKKGPAEN
jgi:hypothetical protein